MKIQKLLLLCGMLMLITWGCEKNEFVDQPKEELQEEELFEWKCEHLTGLSKQWTMGGFSTISACEANGITFFIEDCFDETGYAQGIVESMYAFNATETSLWFVETENEAEADLIFSCREGGCCGCANASFPVPNHPGDGPPNNQTFFPSGGSIGGEIALNINWTSCPVECEESDFDLCFHMHTAMHEVLHILGLYHNNQVGVDPIHIPGTTMGYDPGSVINSGPSENSMGNWCDPSCTFSEDDLTAMQYLYPLDCTCFSKCKLPTTTPEELSVFCDSQPVCWDYSEYPCLAESTITSSNPGLNISFTIDGQICLSSPNISLKPGDITLTITVPTSKAGEKKGCPETTVIEWIVTVAYGDCRRG